MPRLPAIRFFGAGSHADLKLLMHQSSSAQMAQNLSQISLGGQQDQQRLITNLSSQTNYIEEDESPPPFGYCPIAWSFNAWSISYIYIMDHHGSSRCALSLRSWDVPWSSKMNQEAEVIPQEEKQHLKSGMAWLHCSILLAMPWAGAQAVTARQESFAMRAIAASKKKHLETGGSNLIWYCNNLQNDSIIFHFCSKAAKLTESSTLGLHSTQVKPNGFGIARTNTFLGSWFMTILVWNLHQKSKQDFSWFLHFASHCSRAPRSSASAASSCST